MTAIEKYMDKWCNSQCTAMARLDCEKMGVKCGEFHEWECQLEETINEAIKEMEELK